MAQFELSIFYIHLQGFSANFKLLNWTLDGFITGMSQTIRGGHALLIKGPQLHGVPGECDW